MNVFFLEDHDFFSVDIIEYLKENGHNLWFAKTYIEAEEIMKNNPTFDVSIIDVILQNGKTGIHFVSKYEDKLGKILFLTGCVDQSTLDRLSRWEVASKRDVIWDKLDSILESK